MKVKFSSQKNFYFFNFVAISDDITKLVFITS